MLIDGENTDADAFLAQVYNFVLHLLYKNNILKGKRKKSNMFLFYLLKYKFYFKEAKNI
jgi:hypothetical protein